MRPQLKALFFWHYKRFFVQRSMSYCEPPPMAIKFINSICNGFNNMILLVLAYDTIVLQRESLLLRNRSDGAGKGCMQFTSGGHFPRKDKNTGADLSLRFADQCDYLFKSHPFLQKLCICYRDALAYRRCEPRKEIIFVECWWYC